MADLSDVTGVIASLVASAVYPSGISQPSVSGTPVRVFQGWPVPARFDADMAAGTSNVSIYPMVGTSGGCYQPLNRYDTLVAPVHGMTVTVSSNAVTLTGTPGATEYCTIVVDGQHTYSRTGASSSAILSSLLSDLIGTYAGSSISGSTLTVLGSHFIQAAIGSSGILGWASHRQKQRIQIITWSPLPSTRDAIAAPIQVALSQDMHLAMPDGSQAIMIFDHETPVDTWETVTTYRRDLVYCAEYATVPQLTAYQVTSIAGTFFDNITTPTFEIG